MLTDDQLDQLAVIFEAKSCRVSSDSAMLEISMFGGQLSRRDVAIPVESAHAIMKAISDGAEQMQDYEGWIAPSEGYAEFEVQTEGIGSVRYPRRSDKFSFDVRECIHGHAEDPPHAMKGDRVYPVIRVSSSDGASCIEISRNSPLCPPLLPIDGATDRDRSQAKITLKVFLGKACDKEALMYRARELANSFIFELSVRNRLPFSLRQRLDRPTYRPSPTHTSTHVRFPKVSVPASVSVLFSSASGGIRGSQSPTLSFLSYYQILENYFPAAHKKDAVKKLRQILRSLEFDEDKDSSVARLLNTVERSNNASEREQLRTLIRGCASEEKLRDFLSSGEYSHHFSKRGPISAVPAINLKAPDVLAYQVADRVYALRNRIVHAKDDPRYEEAKVLLPVGPEALHLRPDIELIRLLATEAIVDNQ